MPKKYPEEYKQKIIQDYQNGVPIQKISRINNVAISTIYRWLKDYQDEIPAPHYTTLLHKKEHLEHVLKVIHLSGLIDDVPLRKRLNILEALHTQYEEYNVHELCEALNVARGTFYNHTFRRADRRKYEEEQTQLMLQVQQIFDESQQRFGAEKFELHSLRMAFMWGKRESEVLCRSLGWRVSEKTQRRIIRNARNISGRICWPKILRPVAKMKSGLVTLHILKSKIIVSISA